MADEKPVKVWDILVRLFHWSLVISFVIAYLTSEEENIWHIWSGYAVLGLISFRVLWGLIGTRYARFSNFVYAPSAVSRYLKSLLSNKPEHYTGHNPAGGWMILALLISLFTVTVSGLKLYAVEEGKGPLAGVTTDMAVIGSAYAHDDEHEGGEEDGEEEFWEELHEASTNVTLFLIFLHIAGVVVSSRLHRENLVKAMITGYKKE